jgi:hypothetical protein
MKGFDTRRIDFLADSRGCSTGREAAAPLAFQGSASRV